jgi:hypothetical protein
VCYSVVRVHLGQRRLLPPQREEGHSPYTL